MARIMIALAAHRLLFALTGTLIAGSASVLPATADSAESTPETVAPAPASLNVRADRLYTDTKSKANVAEGNVSVQLGNAELHADRIEFDAAYRTLYARGAVRFKRGSQYFQASSFRYNLVQQEGLINDVYGVIDFEELLSNPLTNLETTTTVAESATPARRADMPPVACPPLLPPVRNLWGWDTSKLESTTMPPLPECDDPDRGQRVKPLSLSDRLNSIALGDGGDPQRHVSRNKTTRQQQPIPPAQQRAMRNQAIAKIDQRISNLSYLDSISIEQRSNLPDQALNSVETRLGAIETEQKVDGTISRWRVQASKVLITPDGWQADRMGFSNDPFTPAQTRIDAEDVVAREQANGDLLISARRNRLIVEEQVSIPVTRRKHIKEVENRWVFDFDHKDRDGFFVGRNLDPIELSRDYTLNLQPQFLVQRAIEGQTSTVSELLGLEAELKGQLWAWDTTLKANISTFKPQDFADGSRYWGSIENGFELPWIGNVTVRLFGAYRYRTWNGSLGLTDIHAAVGGFIQQTNAFNWGKLSNSYLWRIGAGHYKADSFTSNNLTNNLRANFYGYFSSSYPIWVGENAPLSPNKAYRYSHSAIYPALSFSTTLYTENAFYGGGTSQTTVGLSAGPTLTLGTLSKPFLDYTHLWISGGVTYRRGSSPFSFDQAIDLGTLGIGLNQQIVGPLIMSAVVGINVDPASTYYGNVIYSNYELRWQKRSYDFGLFFNSYENQGGFRFRLHDFDFKGTGVPFVPYTPSNWMEKTNANRPF